MKIFENLKNKKVLILGFGEEGRSTYRLIRKEYPEKEIFIADSKDWEGFLRELPEEIKKDKNVKYILGKNYLSETHGFDFIVKAPGIPPIATPNTSQTEIFFELAKGKIIGVTATKGKSTTSTLLYQVLKKANYRAFLVGNIGKPSLDVLRNQNDEKSIYVYELSSHQLYGLTKSPHMAVILNVATDHLDWHGTQGEYVSAKKNIVKHQKSSDFAFLNRNDTISSSFAKETKAKVIYFSGGELSPKVKSAILLKGKHNQNNVAAVTAVATTLGIKEEVVVTVLKTFYGLPHRLETIGEYRGVTFIDDSIASNPTALAAAVDSFGEPLTLIMGGYERGLDYRGLTEKIAGKENVKNVLLVGQTVNKMGESLKEAGFKGKLVDLGRPEMFALVRKAFEITQKGGIVLLSPGAASFDMFKDYKDRGNQFKEAVLNLK